MAVQWENGLPILDGKSLLSDVPEYTKILAEAIVPVGLIAPWGGEKNTAPAGWLACNGDTFNTTLYTKLEEVLGQGKTPDLKGKVVVSVDINETIFNDRHKSDGNRDAIIPDHDHTGTVNPGSHYHDNVHSPNHGTIYAASDFGGTGSIAMVHMPRTHWVGDASGRYRTDYATYTTNPSVTINKRGESVTDKNLQPYYVLQYIIKHDYI